VTLGSGPLLDNTADSNAAINSVLQYHKAMQWGNLSKSEISIEKSGNLGV